MSEVGEESKEGIRDRVVNSFTEGSARQAIWAIISVLLAIYVSAVIMEMTGLDAAAAFGSLYTGALQESERIFFFGTPLVLTGLSVALAFRTGLFNIGAEGQVYIGSMAAAIMGFMFALPIFVHPVVCLAVGAITGGLWGFVPGLLKSYRGAHEVVTTMMLSYTAIIFTNWLSSDIFREPNPYTNISQTPPIYDTAQLPLLFQAFGGEYLHAGIILSLLCVVAVAFFLKRTVLGFEMRAVGLNPDAAETAGINPKRNMALAMALSGALSGLAGATEILGNYHRYIINWSPGLGWDGITVAVLGHNSPLGVLVAAMFFGFLRAGGNEMHQQAGVPIEMVSVIQGLIVLFVAAPRLIQWIGNRSISFASDLKESPVDNALGLAGAVFFGFGTVYAFGAAANAPESVVFAVALTSPACLVATISLIAKKSRAPLYSLVASLSWILTAILYVVSGNPSGFGISIGMAMVGFAIIMFYYLLPRLVSQPEGGEQQ